MIVDSSKDYFTGTVVLMFEGEQPSLSEINEYCRANYGFVPVSVDIDLPNDFLGYTNPGRVHCSPI
jgi:hypothetical protein